MACTTSSDVAPNPSRGMRLVRRKRKARLLVAEAMAGLPRTERKLGRLAVRTARGK